jgi:transcription initiation factor IIE alpha subunit
MVKRVLIPIATREKSQLKIIQHSSIKKINYILHKEELIACRKSRNTSVGFSGSSFLMSSPEITNELLKNPVFTENREIDTLTMRAAIKQP